MARPERAELLSMYTNEGLTDGQIARRLKVDRTTVYRWRKHYNIEVEVKRSFEARLKRGGESA